MMNLTIMKLNFALKIETPPKPTIESSTSEKKFYEDLEYSNSCCLMIMEKCMEDSIYASIPKIENAKSSCMLLVRNIQSLQRTRKMSYLTIIR